MARVIITLTIMPESPDTDLAQIEQQARKDILAFVGNTEFKVEQIPVAFGLKSLNITFVMDEAKGDTEKLEKTIAAMPHISSVEVTDVRRSIG